MKQLYDHRDSEYGLQSAVAYAVHHGALGDQMIVVHAKRAGAHPDLAVISRTAEITLLELKLRIESESDALASLCQVVSYAALYRRVLAGRLASWYCHSKVESLCGLSFRGEEGNRVEERNGKLFHIIEQFDKKQVQQYRDAGHEPQDAFACRAADFERFFGRPLGCTADGHLPVSGVVLVAEVLSERAQKIISQVAGNGFNRGILENRRSHKYIGYVLDNEAAFCALKTLNVELRQASPRTWLVSGESTAS